MRTLLAVSIVLLSFTAPVFVASGAPAGPAPLAVCLAIDESTSNWEASDGYTASDPGPVYVRTELVRLVADLLGTDTGGRPVSLALVPYATDARPVVPLTDIRSDAARAQLADAVDEAMRPGGWTSTDRAVAACGTALQTASSGALKYVVLLSDGRPERPDADADAQVVALTQSLLPALQREGVTLDTVLYGDAAANPGDRAAGIMRQLAEAGGGRAYTAPNGLDLLRVSVNIASNVAGLTTASGLQTTVNGSTTIPLEVGAEIESLSFVVIRSRPDLALEIRTPNGETLASSTAGIADETLSPHSLVRTLTRPSAGTYSVVATGSGEMFATMVARTTTLLLPSVTPTAVSPATPTAVPSASPAAAAPTAAAPVGTPTASAGVSSVTPTTTAVRSALTSEIKGTAATGGPTVRKHSDGFPWGTVAIAALLACAAALALLCWLARRTAALGGVIVAWHGALHRTTYVEDLPELAKRGASCSLAAFLPEDDPEGGNYAIVRRRRCLELRPVEPGDLEAPLALDDGVPVDVPVSRLRLVWFRDVPDDLVMDRLSPPPVDEPAPLDTETVADDVTGMAPPAAEATV
jgi:hypothetical protein